jgi:peptidoglycan hydrolase-like protein with peptidoglycan-binding domain
MFGLSARAVFVASGSALAVAIGAAPALATSSATVTGLSPAYGQAGTVVDISGSGLADTTGVQFSGVGAVAPTSATDTQVEATVPTGATSGPVTLSGSGWSVTGPTFTVQAPSGATLTASASRTTYPQPVTFTATLTSDGQPVSGQSARLQHALAGSTTWTQVGKVATTASDGTVAWTITPGATNTYQVVFDASPSYAATTTSQTQVAVRPLVTFTPPGVAPILTATPLRGSVRPGPVGKVVLDRFYGGAWHAKQSVEVGTRGRFTFTVRFPSTGLYSYRVRRPADATHLLGGSPLRRITAVKRTLSSGMTGPDVLALQRRLHALHYDLGGIDGKYGFDTVHAVTAFEKIQGLPRDGVVGRAVWTKLANPRVPHLRHPIAGPAAIEIDLTRQVVYYAVNGHIARILDSSTGGGYYFTGSDGTTQKAITPTGHFAVVYKVNHWVTSKLGTLYRPAYFNNDGYALHGEDLVPPYPASHGCVRITVPAMDRLYAKLYPGLSVWIYRT